MALKLSNLPRKDVLAHVVDKRPDNYFDDEIDIYFDGVLPGGDVTKSYVDKTAADTLSQSKQYTDAEVAKIAANKLYSEMGNNTDGAVTQKFFTESMQAVTLTIEDVENSVSVVEAKVADLETKKQDQLVSGTNIKTVNGQTLLGTGNVEITSEPVTLTIGEFNTIWESA